MASIKVFNFSDWKVAHVHLPL
jgi:hypothetical protein